MKNIATRFISLLCGMAVLLAVAASITSVPALAASNGIYIATATPHYRHPTTGVIEDSGGEKSEVLGQSMTESATHTQALVEVDESGNTFITVRLKLMDNIENPTFQVDGSAVTATLMQEDYTENTADYRMQAGSENSIIRCSMYVVPMGRDVIFYITVSDLQEGSGDFVTSITVNKTDNNSNNNSADNNAADNANDAANNIVTEAPTTAAATTAPVTTAQPTTVQPTTAQPSTAATVGTAETKSGIQVFDAQGNEQVQTTAAATADESGGSGTIAWIVIGAIVLVCGAGFCVWYFGFFKKKAKSAAVLTDSTGTDEAPEAADTSSETELTEAEASEAVESDKSNDE